MIQRILFLVLLGLIVSHSQVEALNFYVNSSTGDNRRSHIVAQDSSTPWKTLTHALKIAHLVTGGRPHVIQVASGTYSPSTGETMPFEITQAGIYVKSPGQVLFDAEGKSRIFTITAPTSDFVLRDVALLNGSAERGGAVYCETCSLKVTNSRIIGNHATDEGDVIYARNGRVKFLNNMVRFNGTSGQQAPLLSLRNSFADTSQREIVRNNTFYKNDSPGIFTTGNRTDISSNIFFGTAGDDLPAIIDSVVSEGPLVRYNIFWDVDVLLLSQERDSTQVVRTIRDTLTLAELGVDLPSFVTNRPDTIAQVGSTYEYNIEVTGNKSAYDFNKVTTGDLPAGIATQDWEAGVLRWTPQSTDVGRHAFRLEVIAPGGQLGFVSYVMEVFSAANFPDTTRVWPIVNVTFEPDTTRALDTLNSIIPSFSSASSAAGNKYANPLFLNVDVNSFQLKSGSPGRDAGNPVVSLRDAVLSGGGVRNDIGFTGGPVNAGPPVAGTTTAVGATALPDSLVTEGASWTYTPTQNQTKNIILIDPIPGHTNPPTLSSVLGSQKPIPIVWQPTISDTGSWLVGLSIFNSDGTSARHYFPLRVRPANEPPRITSTAPSQAFEDSAFSYTVEIVELDNDAVTFELVTAPAGMTINATGVVSWIPTQQDTGSTTVEIKVTDTGGESASQSFTLSVLNTNDNPVFVTVPDTSITEDIPFTLQLAATDIDLADTFFVFTLISGPDSVTVDSSGLLSWTPLQADVGVDTVKVRVADTQGGTDSTSFSITVIEVNDAPAISSVPDTTADEDAEYVYTVVGSDEEGLPVVFELTTAPAAMSIDTTGTIRWTPVEADTGSHAVAIRVSDPAGNNVSQLFNLLVSEVNDAPVLLTRAPADSFFFFEPGQGIVFSVTASDEENDLLSYRWLVDGVIQSATEAQFLHVPDTTSADTVVTRILDGTDSTIVRWIVDARAIPVALLQPDSIDFGTVTLGDSASTTLNLSNPGRTTLVISNLQVSNLELTSVFSASQVLRNETQTLQIRYIAANRGPLATSISFDTNDPDRSTITIPVSGFGLIPTQVTLDLDPAAGNQQRSTGAGPAGDTVNVDIYISEALDIIEANMEVSYDPTVLAVAGFGAGAGESNLLTEPTIVVTEPSTGRVRFAVSTDTIAGSSEDGSSGDGFLGRLQMIINAGAVSDTQTEIQLESVELLSEGLSIPDTLRPEATSVIRVRSRLPTDLNNDGIVNFDDFFQFVALFGTFDPRGDFNNSGGRVDFQDFFVFANTFGARARPVPLATESALEGLALHISERPASADRLEVQLRWSGDVPLSAAAVTMEFDPSELTFIDIEDALVAEPLLWSYSVSPGVVQLAFGRGSSVGGYESDLPVIRFSRHSAAETTIQLAHAVGQTVAGESVSLAAPPETNIGALPVEFLLYPAFPNPFNPETTLSFFVPSSESAQRVRLRVFDLLGQPVRTLVDESRAAGHHAITWHGRNDAGRSVAAGVYLIEMVTPTTRIVHKALYLK